MSALPWLNPKPEVTKFSQLTYEQTKVREVQLSRVLMFYIVGGLLFMLLPGTFLGVWNLISISGRHAAESVSPSWIQAHGHAQILGWIGSFILGIGYYSIPKLRRGSRPGRAWRETFARWPVPHRRQRETSARCRP